MVSGWIRGGGWGLRSLCLVLLGLALVALSAVDVDGDPTTTNLPPVVLASDVGVRAKDDASDTAAELDSPASQDRLALFRRRLVEWVGKASEHSWHTRVRPIRGP